MMLEKRYHITMSSQSQYVIGLYRGVNPAKNRCRHYESFPRQRLLPGHVLEEVKLAIKLKANNKFLQQKLSKILGKK